MDTALITGITGQDGTYLAELLAGKGYRVVGTSRVPEASPAPAGPAFELRTLDLEDSFAVTTLVGELAPAHVYHLAGQSSVALSFSEPASTFASIATSTLNVLEAVRTAASNARLFVAGSGEVFGDSDGTPADERAAFRPLSPYAAAKAAAAGLTRAYRASYGLFACVGFLYNHESPRRSERFVTRKIVRAACEIAAGRRDHLELGNVAVVRDWGWAPEYVEAMWRILTADAADDFIVATGKSHSLEHFVELVFAEVGLSFREHVTSQPALFRPAEARALLADPEHAREKLGWKATVDLEGVARRLVASERAVLGLDAQAAERP